MITYNALIERFREFANAHYFIRAFSHGEPSDLDLDKLQEYPLMHCVYLGASYETGVKVYTLDIYIIDLSPTTIDAPEQAKEVVSDSEQCAEDIISDITTGWIVFDTEFVVRSASVLPIIHKDKNVNCGALLSVSLETNYDWGSCYAPLDGVNPATGENTYQRRGILRMRTINGAVDVQSVRQINVTNGTLTDNGEGIVTLSITGAAGAVDSVNGQTGDVVLDADDIDDTTTAHKFTTAADISKLAGIESGAQVNDVFSVNGAVGDVVVIDIYEQVKNVSGVTLPKGTPVHVTGNAGNEAEVIGADAATNFPAQFILDETLIAGASGKAIAVGFINNVDVPDASIYSPGQEVWLGHSGGWVTTKPTGANAVQKLGVILKVNTGGNKISGVIYGMGNNEDLPNLPNGKIWLGNGSGVPAETTLNTDNVPQGTSNLYHIPTNLTNTPTNTNVAVNSSTGSDTTIPAATTTNAGVMTATDKTKLDGIEAGAEVNPSASEVKTLYESNADTNAFTDAEKTKLAGIAAGAEVNVNADWNAVSGDAQILNKPAIVSAVTGTAPISVTGTTTRNVTISAATTSAAGSMSAADKSKLNGIAAGAEVNQNAFSNVVVGGTTIAADTKTDTLTLVAGANVTITPDAGTDTITIAASGGGTASNAFGIVAVSGQSNVEADASNDTLTLVAGANMTLTTNATTDSVTFAVSGLAAVATSGSYADLSGTPARFFVIKNLSGASYTMVAGDAGYYLRMTNATKITLTLPAATMTGGDEILVEQTGAGVIEVVGASGVTILNTSQFLNVTFGQYAIIGIKCVANNTFIITGERQPA